MKTIMSKFIKLSLFLDTAFISCSKENKVLEHNTSLLIARPWIFEKYGLDENNNGTIEDTEDNKLPCEADDTYAFYANGSGV